MLFPKHGTIFQNKRKRVQDMKHYEDMKHVLKAILPKEQQELVVVCVGTDRSSGDSLGPFVGDFLNEKNLPRTTVYGTIDHPVMALNLVDTMKHIKKNHPHAFIISIDAALGKEKHLHEIMVRGYPLRPGAALKKNLPEVGDISIIGIVNYQTRDKRLNSKLLQSTRLSHVLEMAKTITCLLEETINEYIGTPKEKSKVQVLYPNKQITHVEKIKKSMELLRAAQKRLS